MNEVVYTALDLYDTNPQDWSFAWCAAFINFILKANGMRGTNSNMARSFLEWGKHTEMAEVGDIVVLWRIEKDGPWGHCGLYIKENTHSVWLLGGNQDGIVKIKRYPKWQLLDIRTLDV